MARSSSAICYDIRVSNWEDENGQPVDADLDRQLTDHFEHTQGPIAQLRGRQREMARVIVTPPVRIGDPIHRAVACRTYRLAHTAPAWTPDDRQTEALRRMVATCNEAAVAMGLFAPAMSDVGRAMREAAETAERLFGRPQRPAVARHPEAFALAVEYQDWRREQGLDECCERVAFGFADHRYDLPGLTSL